MQSSLRVCLPGHIASESTHPRLTPPPMMPLLANTTHASTTLLMKTTIPALRASFKNPRKRRVRARGLQETPRFWPHCRPGPLTGRFLKQALTLLPLLLATTGRALDAAPQDAAVAGVPTFSIAERGPHHRIWTNSARGTYTELANGMHYLDPNGQWIESHEQIDILNGVAVARPGPHQVSFS